MIAMSAFFICSAMNASEMKKINHNVVCFSCAKLAWCFSLWFLWGSWFWFLVGVAFSLGNNDRWHLAHKTHSDWCHFVRFLLWRPLPSPLPSRKPMNVLSVHSLHRIALWKWFKVLERKLFSLNSCPPSLLEVIWYKGLSRPPPPSGRPRRLDKKGSAQSRGRLRPVISVGQLANKGRNTNGFARAERPFSFQTSRPNVYNIGNKLLKVIE